MYKLSTVLGSRGLLLYLGPDVSPKSSFQTRALGARPQMMAIIEGDESQVQEEAVDNSLSVRKIISKLMSVVKA